MSLPLVRPGARRLSGREIDMQGGSPPRDAGQGSSLLVKQGTGRAFAPPLRRKGQGRKQPERRAGKRSLRAGCTRRFCIVVRGVTGRSFEDRPVFRERVREGTRRLPHPWRNPVRLARPLGTRLFQSPEWAARAAAFFFQYPPKENDLFLRRTALYPWTRMRKVILLFRVI